MTGIRFQGALSAAVALLAAASNAAATENVPVDPFALYGDSIRFDVYRKDERVGVHTVNFYRRGRDLTVDVRFQIRIDFLFFPAYRYLYTSEGVWRNGRLVRLKARTDDDGEVSEVVAEERDGRLEVRGPNGRVSGVPGIYPTNHWNPGVRGTRAVLNTITGRINKVRIVPRGEEQVEADGGFVIATRYDYTGELENQVWYDEQGRWVKMRFKARDGSTIDYVCRRCIGAAADRAAR